MVTPSKDLSCHNINLISQYVNQTAEAFRIIKIQNGEEDPQYQIERNGFLRQFFLKAKHVLWGGAEIHRQTLHAVIDRDIQLLSQENRASYVNNNTYTDLFLAAQKYNHIWRMHKEGNSEDAFLFKDLFLEEPIHPRSCPEVVPIGIRMSKIARSSLKDIPEIQQPYVSIEGRRHPHKAYYYDEADVKLDHGREGLRIFFSTQRERFISRIGRIIEAIGTIFGWRSLAFDKYHYFSKRENKVGDLYAQDEPLSESTKATSYWIGHATCLFSIPLKSEEGKQVNVHIITDPVEGDLNKILYPRMTAPARPIDACPLPHIYLLSHNHLDHYDEATIKKLKKYQPIMLVPEGDAKKFYKLGFKHVYEQNWWQTTLIPIERENQKAYIKITAVPAHHWSGQCLSDGHHAAFLGYVIEREGGDIYFAGDTARLSNDHIATLRERFNIRTMFQPGGPDEMRKEMKSTHQASVDGLWMHFELMLRNLYDTGFHRMKGEFMQEAKELRTIYMHTKTYKLGNLHFNDTDESLHRIKQALLTNQAPSGMKEYEKGVYHELLQIGKEFIFQDGHLESQDILNLLEEGVIIPKIGSRTELAS